MNADERKCSVRFRKTQTDRWLLTANEPADLEYRPAATSRPVLNCGRQATIRGGYSVTVLLGRPYPAFRAEITTLSAGIPWPRRTSMLESDASANIDL